MFNPLEEYEEKVEKLKAKYESKQLTKMEYLQCKENLTDELMMTIDKDYLDEKMWNHMIKQNKKA